MPMDDGNGKNHSSDKNTCKYKNIRMLIARTSTKLGRKIYVYTSKLFRLVLNLHMLLFLLKNN